ncbi:hypothetical protein GY31_09325 [Lysinibacillus sphaericus]|uniref:hypothetical protein n=1 Tax=Lysinibacillus TaxID=400634 RepID=UPI00084AC74F|nr:hypothetical protein [Lysinibacillus sphaericus]OEC02098.1 hypothetical protein GY31_09325 [Lysinibacillus sphaericus]
MELNNFENNFQEHQNRLFDLEHKKNVEINNKLYHETVSFLDGLVNESSNVETTPLPEEEIRKLEEHCRNVRGYKLDDFPPGSCKRGTRRESKTNVLGPFTLTGIEYSEKPADGPRISYIQVEIKDGRYKSESTIENASACIGKGEMTQHPEGSWSLIVRKGIRTPDIIQFNVTKDHDDDYGKHAEIAASDMCNQICSFIYAELTK